MTFGKYQLQIWEKSFNSISIPQTSTAISITLYWLVSNFKVVVFVHGFVESKERECVCSLLLNLACTTENPASLLHYNDAYVSNLVKRRSIDRIGRVLSVFKEITIGWTQANFYRNAAWAVSVSVPFWSLSLSRLMGWQLCWKDYWKRAEESGYLDLLQGTLGAGFCHVVSFSYDFWTLGLIAIFFFNW